MLGIDRPRDAMAAGRRAALRALEIDPNLAEAHSLLGVFLGIHDFDWDAAERSFQRALQLAPGCSEARTRYAVWLLEPNLRLDEARAQLDLALASDPLSPVVLGCLGHHLIFRREFPQAAERLQLAVELEPDYWWAQVYLAGAYAFQGMFEKAGLILNNLIQSTGGQPLFLASFAFGCGVTGHRQRAEELLNQLLQSSWAYVPPLAVALVYLGLGEADSCLDWLEKAVHERDPLIVEFQPKPLYDGIRHHPRFHALLASMHLVNPW